LLHVSLMCMRLFLIVLFGCSSIFAACSPSYSLYGQPKYKEGFKHFAYVNPNAPKKGSLSQHSVGSFDSFNQFIPFGIPASGLTLLYDTLMVTSEDEPDSLYGLVAQCVELADDKKSISFTLNPNARFNDGAVINASDVVWTFNQLNTKGDPRYKLYFRDVDQVKVKDDHQVTFYLKRPFNRDLVFFIGTLPVFSKSFWQSHDFSKSGLVEPIGSGPYLIKDYKLNGFIRYERVKNYWAENHPTRKGMFNFDELKWVYFKDDTVAFEGFKSHLYDLRIEHRSKLWVTGYNGPALTSGEIIKEEINNREAQGMQGFVFNLRRPMFKDRAVRKAIAMAFDFHWVNDQLLYSQYQRATSFFNNSDLSSTPIIPSKEAVIYKELQNPLPSQFFDEPMYVVDPENEAQMRAQLLEASAILDQAGWKIKDGIRVNKRTGERLAFDILIIQPSFERIILPYQEHLKRLGVEVRVRKVSPSDYIHRLRNFDYDMTTYVFDTHFTPGNELYDYWSSTSAKISGSSNIAGLENKSVDEMVKLAIQSKSREELQDRIRALDRYLMWEQIVVPQWYLDVYRVAYWNHFKRPRVSPAYDLGLMTWWHTS